MKTIVHFSFGVAFGALLMQYFSGRLSTGTDNANHPEKRVDNARSSTETERGLQYPGDGQLSREDISGGVDHSEMEELLNDPETKKNLTFDKVTDGVYLATGYSFVNVIVLEGQDGLVVVDTMESPESARIVLGKIRDFTSKPIKAIVISHHHVDHIGGINVFIEDELNPPDIWSYHTLPNVIKSNMVFGPKALYGAIHQFGMQLGHNRLWPKLPHLMTSSATPVPNRLIHEEIVHVQIAGLNVTFIHVPGEADDELAVWLPDKRVLLSGDDVYKMFPNVYAIRGTSARDPLVWARSVRLMRDLNADFLVPAHGLPVVGSQNIRDLLSAYSSAMIYVHDQTVRLLNEYRHIDDVGKLVRLPTQLRKHPFLREAYGTVEWTAKAVYQRYVGWFTGDPAELFPLTPSEKSQGLVNWIGVDRILEEVELALESGRTQWALELACHVYRIFPDNLYAKWLRMQALRRRASEQLNPSARNYYLTSALDSYGFINRKIADLGSVLTDVGVVMGLMKYRLKAELADGVNDTIVLNFTDTKTVYRLQIVYSVLEIDIIPQTEVNKLQMGVLKIETTEQVWLGILLGKTQAATAYMNGDLTIDGSLMEARRFMSYF